MSNRFHNKWHFANHQTYKDSNIPDAGYDPIAAHGSRAWKGDMVLSAGSGYLSARDIKTNTIEPFSGNWVNFPTNVFITNLSSLSSTVNYQNILVNELSGFIVNGSDTSINIHDISVPGSNDLSINHAPISSNSWVSIAGDLQTQSDLYVSGTSHINSISITNCLSTDCISPKTVNGTISAHGNIDMLGYSISGIGNNSLYFQSGAKIGSDDTGSLNLNTFGTSSFNPQVNIGSRTYTVSSGTMSAMEIPSRVTIQDNLISKQEDGVYFGGSKITNTKDYTNIGKNWKNLRPFGNSYLSVGMSSTGKYQTTGENAPSENRILTSSDYGKTWSVTVNDNLIVFVVISDDGKHQTASFYVDTNEQMLKVSHDYGRTWTQKMDIKAYWGIAMSGDGKYQSVASTLNDIYRSSDYGETWTACNVGGGGIGANNMSMSNDGKYQTAGKLGSQIYVSRDYGVTWTQRGPTKDWYTRTSCMSKDGRYQLQGTLSEKLYISRDYGETWNAITALGNKNWNICTMSGNGKYILACADADYLYISSDYGETWIALEAVDYVFALAMSSDAKYILRGNFYYDEGLYLSIADEVINGNLTTTGSISSQNAYFDGSITLNGSTISVWPSGGTGSDDVAVNTLVHNTSGNWNSVYTTVQSNSATTWNYQGTDLKSLSGNWQNTYTTVQSNSASWAGGANPVVTTLTYATSVTTDLATGDVFNLTLTGNTVLMNPINPTNGKGYTWYIRQDGVGSHGITLGSKFKIPSTATIPLAWSTTASAMDIFAVRADTDKDLFYVVSMVAGY